MKALMNLAIAATLLVGCASSASAADLGSLLRTGANLLAPGNNLGYDPYNSGYANGYGTGYGTNFGTGYGNTFIGSNLLGYPTQYQTPGIYTPNYVPNSAYNPYYGNDPTYNGYYDPNLGAYGNGNGGLKSRILNQAAGALLQMF